MKPTIRRPISPDNVRGLSLFTALLRPAIHVATVRRVLWSKINHMMAAGTLHYATTIRYATMCLSIYGRHYNVTHIYT